MVEVRGVCLTSQDGIERPLSPINFSLGEGERCVLLGDSGTPLSQLLPMLSGLRQPKAGDVYVLGTSTGQLSSEVRQHIGYASGDDVFSSSLTPIDALVTQSALYGMKTQVVSQAARRIIRRLHIDAAEDRPLGLLVPKVRRLVAIAFALIGGPRLLILDNIDRGLSAEDQKDVWNRLNHVVDSKTTVLSVQQTSEFVEDFFSWFVLFRQGEILAQGAPKLIVEQEVGEAIIDFAIQPGELEYYLSRIGKQFNYQIVSNHLRIFLQQRSQGDELARLIPSSYYQVRPATFSDLEAKLKGKV